ncbi:hypothetical protein F5141DRAFT_1059929 [Pisolithus sp. B1]|nr:hypothetical protein F5141DRAFT_1059929 [Pisolithus sp. B1]
MTCLSSGGACWMLVVISSTGLERGRGSVTKGGAASALVERNRCQGDKTHDQATDENEECHCGRFAASGSVDSLHLPGSLDFDHPRSSTCDLGYEMETGCHCDSTPATTPPFITPNTVRDLIPGMWALNMKKLEALMKEIPTKPKSKPAVASSSATQVGSKVVQWSQRQLEKSTKKGQEGAMGTESGSPVRAVEGMVSSGPSGSMAGKDVMEWGIICIWKEWTVCKACHDGKKKCDKAGKPGRKLTVAAPAAAATEPQDPPLQQSPPLFFPSSGPPTPTPTSGFPEPLASHAARKPAKKPAESSRGSSEFLSAQVKSSQDEEASKVEGGEGLGSTKVEIDLTETEEVATLKGDTQSPAKGKRKTQGGRMHPIEELDKRISDIEQLVKWGKDALLDLYVQVAQVWWQENFVEASSENP